MAVVAMLAGNAAFAQGNMGRGAQQGTTYASNDDSFAWGIGLGGLAVLGIVVGLTAASAASSPSTFSH